MNDPISRAAALDAIDGMKPMQGNMEQLAMKALCWAAVKSIPAVDAAPVVYARWIDECCSVCGTYVYHGYADNYCPHCGAKMMEVEHGNRNHP